VLSLAHKYRGRQKLLALALATPWGDVSAISTGSLTTATTEEKHNTPFPTTRWGGGGRYFPNFSNIYWKLSFPPFSGNSKVELLNTVQCRGSLVLRWNSWTSV
jgi:hypothetical protein